MKLASQKLAYAKSTAAGAAIGAAVNTARHYRKGVRGKALARKAGKGALVGGGVGAASRKVRKTNRKRQFEKRREEERERTLNRVKFSRRDGGLSASLSGGDAPQLSWPITRSKSKSPIKTYARYHDRGPIAPGYYGLGRGPVPPGGGHYESRGHRSNG